MSLRVLAGLLAFASGEALACKCAYDSIAEQFSQASIVFIGSTTADPSHPGKAGETITFQVVKPLKGEVVAGSTLAVDPLFETDCTAPYVPATRLLVFTHPVSSGAPIVSACSVRATEPFSLGQRLLQPSPEVIEFLRSLP